jgi:hypothetical protein
MQDSIQAPFSFGGTQLHVLRGTPGWQAAVEALRRRYERFGSRAEEAASTYAQRYRGRRAAMVFDVVHSANRNYETTVVNRVERFSTTSAARSMLSLSQSGPEDRTGFRRFEADAMMQVAARLAAHCARLEVDDDEGCREWANGDDPGLLHRLDPVIGSVKGMGFTLYRYLRMRCGADDVKPDRRVAGGLHACGFPFFSSPEHIYVLALAAAFEAGLRPLVLDQLLWSNE